ncbi:MAG TPA: response regulator [Gaiellaceae bacterium]|nr:response regulator [Gaiellaceae bacterium]
MSAVSNDSAAAGVLVVDDDEALLKLVQRILEASGIEVTTAAAGESALAAARRERPALVILDVHMPGLSGYEVCRVLREEHGAELPIMFLSGERTESYDRVAGLIMGADDYMTKPFAPDELLARTRRLIRRRVAAGAGRGSLTSREREVLQLLAQGRTQHEIAHSLVIAPKTCAKHIERILEKLKVHSRAQAVALAFREELVAARR